MTTTLLTLREKLRNAIGDEALDFTGHATDAINNASREIYPNLYKPIDDKTLITGNILPNGHFRDWSQTTYPDHYSLSNVTAVASTTAGTYRGGTKSAKVTASAGNGYLYISSNSYPRLLDLMGKTVTFKCWAYPEVANDATIEIYTVQADGSAQTLTSTTSCPAGKFTLLELEDQELNDDLTEVQIRFKITTNAKYVYFDDARVTGRNVYEYLLPVDLQNGDVREVWMQGTGYSDDICDDLQPRFSDLIYGWDVFSDGTYKYLRLPFLYSSEKRIRLLGICPLEEVDDDTDTITLDGEKVNLLITYAAYLLYEMEIGTPSSEDVSRYERQAGRWWAKYKRLQSHMRMTRPGQTLNLTGVY